MSFKLLAIRPLEGCEKHILNNLQKDQFYFFDDSYEQYDSYDFIRKKENYNELNPEFYYGKNENTESTLQSININAIVGKNGSGKSSIIEFLLRSLNNFFKSIDSKKENKLDKLIYVEGLVGELYLLQNNEIFKIYINFSISKRNEKKLNPENEYRKYIKVTKLPLNITDKHFVKDNFKNKLWNDEEIQATEEAEIKGDKFVIDDYFFTMYVNYSLYGLDEQDYEQDGFVYESKENKSGNKEASVTSWLSKIFHKNDGYQTPVVIHPYRESAMIDVRREKDLMKQRLAALIFTNDEYRTVIPEYNFDEIRLSLKKETALDYFLEDIFNNQSNKIRVDIFGINVSGEILKEKIEFLSSWIDKNKSLLERIKISQKANEKDYDIKTYLYAAFSFLNKIEVVKDEDKNSNKLKGSFLSYISEYSFDKVKIESISKELKKDVIFKKILDHIANFNLETVIRLIQLTNSYHVFLKHFNYNESDFNFKSRDFYNLKEYLFWYCVVKSVKLLKYNTHLEYSESFKPANIFTKTNEEIVQLGKKYFRDIIEIDKSHITEKLRRTILLLELIENPIEGNIIDGKKRITSNSSDLTDFYQNIVNESRPRKISPENWEFTKSVSELGKLISDTKTIHSSKNIELTDLLPPPIFEYDFYSSTNNKEEKIPLSKISSGQFQKIGLLSSIVYHLKNLDSIQERANLNAYKHVLVVLDEIELYFHPAQQREFINDLVRLLKLNKFKQIENINIFFITHSPFILSDIPSQNVLKLDKGKPADSDSINSFGANIHDLLADEFFLDNGFMGEFAKKKINEVVDFLNYKILSNSIEEIDVKIKNTLEDDEKKRLISKNNKLKKEIKEFNSISKKYNKKYCEDFILQIGEPMIKMSLLELLNKAYKTDSKRFLQDQIEKLQKMLDDSST